MELILDAPPLLKVFWFIAMPSSLIFLIQSIMTFVGLDGSDGLQADFESDLEVAQGGSHVFSLRNLIAFLLGFSWTGISFYDSLPNPGLLIGTSVAVGTAFVLLYFFIIKKIQQLSEDNTFDIKRAIGKNGEVYLMIPGNNSGKGLVQVSVNGTYKELKAITGGSAIPSGSIVKIKDITSDNILLVETI
jgi:hypothetical protein